MQHQTCLKAEVTRPKSISDNNKIHVMKKRMKTNVHIHRQLCS